MEDLGTYIRNLRVQSGYSPEAFARLNLIPTSALLQIEHGRAIPTKWHLLQLATKFSLNAQSLFVQHHIELLKKSPDFIVRTELITNELKRWLEDVMVIDNFPVHQPLSNFIESIIYYKNSSQPHKSEIVFPDGMPQLIINLQNSSSHSDSDTDNGVI